MFLNSVKTVIKPEPMREYFFGAGTPAKIVYLRTDGPIAVYMRYPYAKESKTAALGFEQLIQVGCESRLKSHKRSKEEHERGEDFAFFYPWMQEEINNLEAILRGESMPEVDPADYAYWDVRILYHGTGDAWSVIEQQYHVSVSTQIIATSELVCNMQYVAYKALDLPADLFTVTGKSPATYAAER